MFVDKFRRVSGQGREPHSTRNPSDIQFPFAVGCGHENRPSRAGQQPLRDDGKVCQFP